jgi:uncharacterized coiled-coil DUF342 family protein
MEKNLIRSRFINALEKTRENWKNDKRFKEIIEKMLQGKDLNKEEFDEVYSILQECRQCPTATIAKDPA